MNKGLPHRVCVPESFRNCRNTFPGQDEMENDVLRLNCECPHHNVSMMVKNYYNSVSLVVMS